MTPEQRGQLHAVALYIAADEGGVADVGDGKGLTRYGQTEEWLTRWKLPYTPPSTSNEAQYNTMVWMERAGLAPMVWRDEQFGYALCTFAFHAGERVAIKALQRRLGVTVDGVIGPETLLAVRQTHHKTLRLLVLAEYTHHLMASLGSLRVDRRKFARGWANRLSRLIVSMS